MPFPNRPYVYRAWESSPFQIAYAVRSYTNDDGYEVCDLRNPDNAFQADGCIVMGAAVKAINAPSGTWDKTIDLLKHPLVCFAFLPKDQGAPIVFDLAYPRIQLSQPNQADGSRSAATHRDKAVENGGSQATVKDDGRVYVEAAGDVFIILKNGATMQVVDTNGDERAALAGPTYGNDLALSEAVNRIENILSRVSATPPGGALTFVAVAGPTSIYPLGATSFGFTLEQIQSALLHLSSKNGAA